MPSQLVISDYSFQEASWAIAKQRNNTPGLVSRPGIEKVLRAYVDCGQKREIADYSPRLSGIEQAEIFQAVAAKTNDMFAFNPYLPNVGKDLAIMYQLAALGMVSPLIAFPRIS